MKIELKMLQNTSKKKSGGSGIQNWFQEAPRQGQGRTKGAPKGDEYAITATKRDPDCAKRAQGRQHLRHWAAFGSENCLDWKETCFKIGSKRVERGRT